MNNLFLVSKMLEEKGRRPARDGADKGMDLSVHGKTVTISASADELVELADLLISLALSKEKHAHWHVDSLNMMREGTEYELIVEKY